MIKLKKIAKFLFEGEEAQGDAANYIPETSTKSINDEFEVNDWMLREIETMLLKVNKKLTARHMPPLELKIIKSEWVEDIKRKKNRMGITDPIPIRKFISTIKIVGDIPEIKDYEFIAKIEHGEGGNILNTAPNTSVEK